MNPTELQDQARRHLWPHYTEMSALRDGTLPVIVRGEGCTVEDSNGRRYLDGLAGLFCVQIGYSHGAEIGQAAAAQLTELPYYPNWSYAHPRAIELATEVAGLAPEGLERVFFVSGGADAVETAWKLACQYFRERGERRWKVVSRHMAWHGTSLGALSINGVPGARLPFEPLVPGAVRTRNTGRFRRPAGESDADFCAFLLDDLEQAIIREGPSTVAMVIMEPVQNVGGALTAPAGYFEGMRAICDRYGILLCADEVITGFGRMGEWFASTRYGLRPDLITCAKGLSSGHAPIGAVIASDELAEPFLKDGSMFLHGLTFGAHPVSAAIALKNLEIMRRERIVEHVAEQQGPFEETLRQLLELPIVGDVRGAGFFYTIELVSDPDTLETFDAEQSKRILHDFVSPGIFERGLICRTDDRASPLIQLSPPLIAGQAEFDRITSILGDVLAEAGKLLP